jgi:hypothetical protein
VNLLIGALMAVGGVLAVILAVQGTQGQFYQVITGQTAPKPTQAGSSSSSPIGSIIGAIAPALPTPFSLLSANSGQATSTLT